MNRDFPRSEVPEREPVPERLRPFVLVNMAMSADGKIATANRAVSSFGSSCDQHHMLQLRATVDAIMAGARTIDLNPVTLGPGSRRFRNERRKRGLEEYPLRIVVSGSASVNPEADLFQHTFSPIILLTTGKANPDRLKPLQKRVAEVWAGGKKEIDFRRALQYLRNRWGVRRLLVEGGGELNSALFRADVVDELHVTICPWIIGGRSAPTIADGIGAKNLAAATRLEVVRSKRVAEEMFLVLRVKRDRSPGGPLAPSPG